MHRQYPGEPAALYWPRAAWFAQLRDLDDDQLLDLPPGVDALCVVPRPGATRFTPGDVAFSLDRDDFGFDDGSLLRMDPRGGLEVLVSESELVQALDVQSGRFDLDAAHVYGELLWFSVKDGLATGQLGDVQDGDVLLYDRAQGSMSRLYSEAQIQDLVNNVSPGAAAIGDVRSLSVHPVTDELCFTVQSPTDQDATLYGDGQGGRAIPGFLEQDYGFQVSTELDAFTFLDAPMQAGPTLDVDIPCAAPGDVTRLKLRHGTPLGIAKGIFCRRRGFAEADHGGVAAIYLDQSSALYQRQFQGGWMHPTAIDASGSAAFDWTAPVLPPGYAWVDHHFQAIDLVSGALSNPVVVRVR